MIFKVLLFIAMLLSPLYAITGLEIAQKVHDRDDGDNITSQMKMILIDKNGHKRVRQLKHIQKTKVKILSNLCFFSHPQM